MPRRENFILKEHQSRILLFDNALCSDFAAEMCEHHENCTPILNKDWEDARCSVCMEYPHKAALLLCSSHENGCRPYMCGTSFRYSNCLEQYKNSCAMDLACPLCRGQVKGWTVVEPAREYLNTMKRVCAHDDCAFVGTFKELRRHVRSEHPSTNPQKAVASLEQKWRMMELEQDGGDVISTIRSTAPGGASVFSVEGNPLNMEEEESDPDYRRDPEMMALLSVLRPMDSTSEYIASLAGQPQFGRLRRFLFGSS